MRRIGIIILFELLCCLMAYGQGDKRYANLSSQLDSIARIDSKYLEKVDVSVTNFPVADLLKTLAVENNLNMNFALDKHKGQITCNLEQVPIKDVLLVCCRRGGLDFTVEDGILTFFPYQAPTEMPKIRIEQDSLGRFQMDFTNIKIDLLVRKLILASGQNILYAPTLEGRKLSGFGVDLSMDNMMESIASLNGLRCVKNDAGIWMIGEKGKEKDSFFPAPEPVNPHSSSVYGVRVFPMQYRTTDNVLEVIPSRLSEDVEIKVFPELNSLVLSGSVYDVENLESYLSSIDKSVPLITIDVIIVDVTDKKSRETGLTLGKGREPSGPSYGILSPGVDVSLGAGKINQLIQSFNGLGLVNLGTVGPNFYADLKLLEEDGMVTLRSTPKLSTLNGSKAVLKSGEVKYYKESQVNIIGTQNPLQSESYLWKNVEASFVLDMTPTVSADSTITIRVELNQDEFTERDGGDLTAPPGMTKRSFNSIVKVKNGEMILLGGIEKNLVDDTVKGLPWISRVPVLRLFMGNVKKTNETQKLNVFIRPSIVL